MADRIDSNPFRARTVIWVIAAGLFAFAGFLLLTAYAPEFKMRGDGGTHAYSKSAVGYSGLYALERDLDEKNASLVRDRTDWASDGLLIVTLSPETDRDALKDLVAVRPERDEDAMTTLFVLPKWAVIPLPNTGGWVMEGGTIPASALAPLVKELGAIALEEASTGPDRLTGEETGIDIAAPKQLRYLSGAIDPVLTDGKGHVVLGRIGANRFILADPDLLSNQGLKTLDGAKAAIAMIDGLRPFENRKVAFDLVLSGVGQSRNLLRLMFEPPFLAFTLALLVAAMLTGWHAFGRFGPALIEGRAIPFGKRALADNGAILINRAGREGSLGDRYVAVVRDAVASALGAKALSGDAIEPWLATLPGDFARLAAEARAARDAPSVLAAARALYHWKKDLIRDH